MSLRNGRAHAALPHTADTGFRAGAPTLAALFEEAALALAELSSDCEPGAPPTSSEGVELEATDLAALAFAWLNELIGRAEVARAALVGASVDLVRRRRSRTGLAGWRLVGRCDLRRFDAGAVRPRRPPKSATLHGLQVRRAGSGWEMVAYLDV
jgi:SHS2 domain-containing protein